jgi:hypothetical protein
MKKGFGVVEVLMVIVITGLAVFIGYLILNKQNDAKTEQEAEQPIKAEDETADWFAYEPAGKEYKFKVADGWKLYEKIGDNKSLFSIDSLALIPSTRGQVLPNNNESGFGEIECGLFIDWYQYGEGRDTDSSDEESTVDFLTNSGLAVEKHYNLLTEDDYGGPAGTKVYGYLIRKDSKEITIVYSACPDNGDYHDILEKVVRTIEIN